MLVASKGGGGRLPSRQVLVVAFQWQPPFAFEPAPFFGLQSWLLVICEHHSTSGSTGCGKCIGISLSFLGESRSNSEKSPAQASLFVRNDVKLNRFRTVAGSEECSNCAVD
eukprot:SAG31_NODE_34692_length_330_cov_1.064935_1_plen_110_part_11